MSHGVLGIGVGDGPAGLPFVAFRGSVLVMAQPSNPLRQFGDRPAD